MVHCMSRTFILSRRRLRTDLTQLHRDLEKHTCSKLAAVEWRTLPWQNFEKDSLQYLFDIGFDLAALLEQADLCDNGQMPEAAIYRRAQLSLAYYKVRDALEEWYAEHWGWRGPGGLDQDDPEQQFASLWEAMNIGYWWMFIVSAGDCFKHNTPAIHTLTTSIDWCS